MLISYDTIHNTLSSFTVSYGLPFVFLVFLCTPFEGPSRSNLDSYFLRPPQSFNLSVTTPPQSPIVISTLRSVSFVVPLSVTHKIQDVHRAVLILTPPSTSNSDVESFSRCWISVSERSGVGVSRTTSVPSLLITDTPHHTLYVKFLVLDVTSTNKELQDKLRSVV